VEPFCCQARLREISSVVEAEGVAAEEAAAVERTAGFLLIPQIPALRFREAEANS